MSSGYGIFIVAAVSYALALVQTQFFSFFPIAGVTIPLVLLVLLPIILREHPNSFYSIAIAFGAGVVLDIFSDHVIGFHVLLFSSLVAAVKYTLLQYVRFSSL